MLYKIAIENFFSIAEAQELNFAVPNNAPDLNCFKTTHANEKVRLPTVISFFGPNASGKSTILRAVTNSILFAVQSFDWTDQISLCFQAYRSKKWLSKPTKITLEFASQLTEHDSPAVFRYELHIAHKNSGYDNKTVSYEALSYAPKGKFRVLFKREAQQFYFGREFDISSKNKKDKEAVIRPDASVISTLAKYNHSLSARLSRLIGLTQSNIIGLGKFEQTANQFLSHYFNDKDCLERLNREIRRLDIGIESMVVEQYNQDIFAKFQHTGLDDLVILPEESTGTRRFIELFPRLHYALANGSVALIDELDTDLHPLLVPELFRWFNDPKRNARGAQLLFTAHNPAILDELEKEQIFFTEKLNGQPTRIYGAKDITGLRREPSLMKKYLAGELGALPQIG
jgi:AAA15 family ATPase/GTPase